MTALVATASAGVFLCLAAMVWVYRPSPNDKSPRP